MVYKNPAIIQPGLHKKPVVGFLFNHDELHQVAHTAPIIEPLYKLGHCELTIITSTQEQEHEVRKYISPKIASKLLFVRLDQNRAARILGAISGNIIPFRRIGELQKNRWLFASLDALVVPETTSFMLKTRFGVDKLKLIYLPHGAGDRSVGFQPVTKHADLVLLSGPKVRDRMLSQNVITPDGHAIIGYPKFDSVRHLQAVQFFSDDKPVVLYNPHFDPRLSSWYKLGEAVLDYFAHQNRYNLIFAPHVMLFGRKIQASTEHMRIKWRRELPERFLDLSNIHIDLGSQNSVDMTYTRSADIYLGDVSSQVYEFIQKPRPCIFLNSHASNWEINPSYVHWKLGQVANSINELRKALSDMNAFQAGFEKMQQSAFSKTFDLKQKSSAQRAADAISHWLTKNHKHAE